MSSLPEAGEYDSADMALNAVFTSDEGKKTSNVVFTWSGRVLPSGYGSKCRIYLRWEEEDIKFRLYLERESMARRDTILLVSSPHGMDSVRLKKKKKQYFII